MEANCCIAIGSGKQHQDHTYSDAVAKAEVPELPFRLPRFPKRRLDFLPAVSLACSRPDYMFCQRFQDVWVCCKPPTEWCHAFAYLQQASWKGQASSHLPSKADRSWFIHLQNHDVSTWVKTASTPQGCKVLQAHVLYTLGSVTFTGWRNKCYVQHCWRLRLEAYIRSTCSLKVGAVLPMRQPNFKRGCLDGAVEQRFQVTPSTSHSSGVAHALQEASRRGFGTLPSTGPGQANERALWQFLRIKSGKTGGGGQTLEVFNFQSTCWVFRPSFRSFTLRICENWPQGPSTN